MNASVEDLPFQIKFSRLLSVYYLLSGPLALLISGYIYKEYLYGLNFSAPKGSAQLWLFFSQPTAFNLLVNSTAVLFALLFLRKLRPIIYTLVEPMTSPWQKREQKSGIDPSIKDIYGAALKSLLLLFCGYMLTIIATISLQFASIKGGYITTTSLQNVEFGSEIVLLISHTPIIGELLLFSDLLEFPSPIALITIAPSIMSFYWGVSNLAYIFNHREFILANRRELPKIYYFVKITPYLIPLLILIAWLA